MRTHQNMIASLMEDGPFSAGSSGMGGMASMVNTPSIAVSMNPLQGSLNNDQSSNTYDDTVESEFSKDQILMAKDFVECVGGIDVARKLIDKCAECEECLDFVDDRESSTADDISIIASDTLECP